MKSRTISPNEWLQFTEGFSRRHEGWIVSLLTEPRRGQRDYVARDVTLRRVEIDKAVGQPSVVVTVDNGDDRHLSHTISKPESIVVEENDRGAEVTLRVASELGAAFTIEFRSPMPVSMVDGVLEDAERITQVRDP